MPKLVYHDSSGTKGTVEMGAETILIGRAADCQIQTQDGLVSRRHARVSYDGAYWIEDNGSANGVYVGSERVQRYKLRPGDVFRCGHLEVRFEVEDMNRTSVTAAPSAANIAQAMKPSGPGPAPPPAPALFFGDSSARGASGRSTPSSASAPPGVGDVTAAVPPLGAKAPAGSSGIMRPATGQKPSPSATSIPPPPPSPYPEAPAPTQMQRHPPPPPPTRGFPDVSPVTNVPPRSSQSIPPPPPVPNELALIRSELEGERQRRMEVEHERDVALRRADDASQAAQEAQLQAQDAQRKADELSSRVTDGDSERLRRRIEQLESELKRKGGGGGGGGEALRAAEAERDRLRAKVAELEARPAPAAPAANPDQEMELIRFRRKIEQLESDLRRARSGQPEDKGPDPRVAELQAEVRKLTEERDAAIAASKSAGEARPGGGSGSSEELERAKRRIDQLESEARRRPVGSVSDEKRMEAQRAEVESVLRQLRDTERERDSLREMVSRNQGSAGPTRPPQAVIDNLTTVSDGLADMRAALRATGDDLAVETLEQVRKALRQACNLLGLFI